MPPKKRRIDTTKGLNESDKFEHSESKNDSQTLSFIDKKKDIDQTLFETCVIACKNQGINFNDILFDKSPKESKSTELPILTTDQPGKINLQQKSQPTKQQVEELMKKRRLKFGVRDEILQNPKRSYKQAGLEQTNEQDQNSKKVILENLTEEKKPAIYYQKLAPRHDSRDRKHSHFKKHYRKNHKFDDRAKKEQHRYQNKKRTQEKDIRRIDRKQYDDDRLRNYQKKQRYSQKHRRDWSQDRNNNHKGQNKVGYYRSRVGDRSERGYSKKSSYSYHKRR